MDPLAAVLAAIAPPDAEAMAASTAASGSMGVS